MTTLDFELNIPILKPSIVDLLPLVDDPEALRPALDELRLLPHPLLRDLLHALPVFLVIEPLALLRLAVGLDELPPAVDLAVAELARLLLQERAVELLQPDAVHVVLAPLPLLPAAVRPLLHAEAVLLPRLEHAQVCRLAFIPPLLES